MKDQDAVKSGVSLERDADPLSSGVSLEREPDVAPARPAGQSVENWLESIERGAIAAADANTLRAIAGDETVPAEARFRANCLAARYALDHQDWLRCVFHGEVALPYAKSGGQRAKCYELIFLAKKGLAKDELTPECVESYEQFAQEAAKSVCAGERMAIELLKDGTAEQMQDYALLAAAHKAWSCHPENQDDFDREEAEAAYHRYSRLFEERQKSGSKDAAFRGAKGDCGAERWRQELLAGKAPARNIGDSKDAPAQTGGAAAGAPAVSAGASAPGLTGVPGEVARFITRYGQLSVGSAGGQYVRDYTAVAQRVVDALRGGDGATMRYVVENPQLFEGMQDYTILCSAAWLWFMHPENTNVGERLRLQSLGEEWTQKCLELSEPEERYPMNVRWRQLAMPAERLQSQWTELLKYVLQALRQYNS